MRPRQLFVVFLVLCISSVAVAIVENVTRPRTPVVRPDPRLDRLCWQIGTMYDIYEKKTKVPIDLANLDENAVMFMAFKPLNQICHEPAQTP